MHHIMDLAMQKTLEMVLVIAIPILLGWIRNLINIQIKKHKAEWLRQIAYDVIEEIRHNVTAEEYDDFVNIAAERLADIGHISKTTAKRIIMSVFPKESFVGLYPKKKKRTKAKK